MHAASWDSAGAGMRGRTAAKNESMACPHCAGAAIFAAIADRSPRYAGVGADLDDLRRCPAKRVFDGLFVHQRWRIDRCRQHRAGAHRQRNRSRSPGRFRAFNMSLLHRCDDVFDDHVPRLCISGSSARAAADRNSTLQVVARQERRRDDNDVARAIECLHRPAVVGNGVWREVTVDVTDRPLSFSGTVRSHRHPVRHQQPRGHRVFRRPGAAVSHRRSDFREWIRMRRRLPPPPQWLGRGTATSTCSACSANASPGAIRRTSRASPCWRTTIGAAGPGGTRGGELRQFAISVGANTRTVNASGSGASGFGYVVSHPNDDTSYCVAGDSSSLGHFFAGTWTRVFEGRHHAIFRFQQNYPRYCSTAAPNQERDVPVTIDWIFSTGRDNPLWAITLRSVGAAREHPRRRFARAVRRTAVRRQRQRRCAQRHRRRRLGRPLSNSSPPASPVSLQSQWTWNTPNTIPYVKLWTTAIDATMGTVQTQPITQQDAGGYFGSDRWNTTSATNACTAGDEYAGSPRT